MNLARVLSATSEKTVDSQTCVVRPAWMHSATMEYADKNIRFTSIHMPLVRTGMIEATGAYKNVQGLTPAQAAALVHEAIINKTMEVNTRSGEMMRLLGLISPELNRLLLSTLYQLTYDSAAAKASAVAKKAAPDEKSVAARAMDALRALEIDRETLESISNILKGYHT